MDTVLRAAKLAYSAELWMKCNRELQQYGKRTVENGRAIYINMFFVV